MLRHVDPYEFRDYLRQMVQSKRVGNTSLQQNYPGNTTTAPLTATVSSPELATPANAQPGYNPPLQLGSNTAVECLKYADGTGLLFVSAEDYRFEDHENGMGIDSIVAMLDNPALGAINYGSQMFFYLPKFVPAQNLLPLIQNMGMNISDVTELWQGQDVVAIDPDLNWLIFDVSNYSCDNIAKMLALYDVPIPQVRLRIRVYELYSENDERMGIDFQSWKNNEGADLFSVGGRYRNNWAAVYNGGLNRADGSERTSFYNFNPKWNTRYLDFLASRGKAKVLHTGELCVRNNTPAQLSRTTQIFYSDTSQPVNGAIEPGTTIDPSNGTPFPDAGVGPYELLSSIAAWFGRSIDHRQRGTAGHHRVRRIRLHDDGQQRLGQPRRDPVQRDALELQSDRLRIERKTAHFQRQHRHPGGEPATRKRPVRHRRTAQTGAGQIPHRNPLAHGSSLSRLPLLDRIHLDPQRRTDRRGRMRLGLSEGLPRRRQKHPEHPVILRIQQEEESTSWLTTTENSE